jgi:hypothetical protein
MDYIHYGNPWHEFDILEFLEKNFWFENLMALTNFTWNFKAFRSRIKHFKVLRTHQGLGVIFFSPPLIFFWRKP